MNRLATIFFLFCCMSITAVQAQSSGSIEGQVFDLESSEALTGVNIVLKGTNYGAATNINGDYKISNIPSGTYTLRATYLGYETIEQEVNIRPGQTLTFNLEMKLTFLGRGKWWFPVPSVRKSW
ncbi:MAG: carboxypeptidase-like regulatory domain-containing protein [Gracilimonas sp.]|nr:carboxypeptidase-like regulatory domain-containing protein [Gracilimonas sp.]